MNRTTITAVVAVSLMGCAKKEPPAPAPEPVKETLVGRYQLVAGEREIIEFSKDKKTAATEKEKVILRIDTVTGIVDQLKQVITAGDSDKEDRTPFWSRIKD